MASSADVVQALLTRAENLPVGVTVVLPEGTEAPEAPSAGHVEVLFFSNQPLWSAVDTGKIDQGFLQVTVVWPRGDGLIRAHQTVDIVKDYFPKGLVLNEGSARVKISSDPWNAAPISDEHELRIPITIPWTA